MYVPKLFSYPISVCVDLFQTTKTPKKTLPTATITHASDVSNDDLGDSDIRSPTPPPLPSQDSDPSGSDDETEEVQISRKTKASKRSPTEALLEVEKQRLQIEKERLALETRNSESLEKTVKLLDTLVQMKKRKYSLPSSPTRSRPAEQVYVPVQAREKSGFSKTQEKHGREPVAVSPMVNEAAPVKRSSTSNTKARQASVPRDSSFNFLKNLKFSSNT